jgi:hypothetical protein
LLTVDFAPTLAELAKVELGHIVDGQSFDKLFHDNPKSPPKGQRIF